MNTDRPPIPSVESLKGLPIHVIRERILAASPPELKGRYKEALDAANLHTHTLWLHTLLTDLVRSRLLCDLNEAFGKMLKIARPKPATVVTLFEGRIWRWRLPVNPNQEVGWWEPYRPRHDEYLSYYQRKDDSIPPRPIRPREIKKEESSHPTPGSQSKPPIKQPTQCRPRSIDTTPPV